MHEICTNDEWLTEYTGLFADPSRARRKLDVQDALGAMLGVVSGIDFDVGHEVGDQIPAPAHGSTTGGSYAYGGGSEAPGVSVPGKPWLDAAANAAANAGAEIASNAADFAAALGESMESIPPALSDLFESLRGNPGVTEHDISERSDICSSDAFASALKFDQVRRKPRPSCLDPCWDLVVFQRTIQPVQVL